MASRRSAAEQVILAALRRGSAQRYELDLEGARRIALVIQSVLDRPNAIAELRRTLEIAAALRRELESPAAADALEQVLRENATAAGMIALHVIKSGALDETRAFRAREGREEPLSAPNDRIEEDTVKLAEFLDPASCGRVRRVSRRRGEAHDRGSDRDQDSTDASRSTSGPRRGGSRSGQAVG